MLERKHEILTVEVDDSPKPRPTRWVRHVLPHSVDAALHDLAQGRNT